jgi:hypothetical protein
MRATGHLGSLLKAVKQSDLIVTQRLRTWLLGHDYLPMTGEALQAVLDALATPPRIRSASFAGSSSGACLRAQELAFLGTPRPGTIDPQLSMIFADGHFRHLRWQAMLLMAGILHRAEFPLPWGQMRSMGTADGMGIVPDDHPKSHWRGKEFGFELKGENSNKYRKTIDLGPSQYYNQVDRYFLHSGYDLWVIIVENKDNQGWTEWVIERDEARLSASRDELRELNRAIDARRLHALLPECRSQTGPTFRNCPFGGRGGPCVTAGAWPSAARP